MTLRRHVSESALDASEAERGRAFDRTSREPELAAWGALMLLLVLPGIAVAVTVGGALLLLRTRERKHRVIRAEAAASSSRLHASLSNAGVAVLAVNREGVVTWGEGGLAGLGWDRASCLGRSAWDVFHGVPELAAELRAGLRGRRGTERICVGESSFDLSYAPRFDEAGKIVEVVAVVRDASHEQTESDRAERLANVRSRILGVMGYRLRGQLSTVLGATELAGRGDSSMDWLAEIGGASARLLTYIEHLVDFLELDADRMRTHPVAFSLRDVLDRLDAKHRKRALADGTVFVVRAPRVAMEFEGDVARIEQALDLILSVALGTNPGGQVILNVDVHPRHADEAGLVISVEDSGRGLSPEARARVFDGFESASAFWATRSGNSGLELPLARRLASLLGGALEVDSEIGVGTTLRLSLDLPRTWMVNQPSSEEHHSVIAGRVLMVDDDDQQRRIHRALAEACGWTVIEAKNGAEALESLMRGLEVDAMLTELYMPLLDGLKFAAVVAERWPELPVGVLTADPAARTAGPDATSIHAWAVKPTSVERLAEVLSTLGDRRARASEPAESGSPLDGSALDRLRSLDPVDGAALVRELAVAFVAAAPLQMLQLANALSTPGPGAEVAVEVVASLELSARLLGLERLTTALTGLEADLAAGAAGRESLRSVAMEVAGARAALERDVLSEVPVPMEATA